jgi:hypothetical protein
VGAGLLAEPSVRQLATAPGLRRSPSATVTTRTTLTSEPIDDVGCEAERLAMVEAANIEDSNFALHDRIRQARFGSIARDWLLTVCDY